MADHKDLSKAAAKLYAEILSTNGELPSYSIVLPLDRTWAIDSIDFPNAPHPTPRHSTHVEIVDNPGPGPTYFWLSISLFMLWCICLNPIALLLQVPAVLLSLSVNERPYCICTCTCILFPFIGTSL